LFLERASSVEEKLKCRVSYCLSAMIIVSLPKKVTFWLIILPEPDLI